MLGGPELQIHSARAPGFDRSAGVGPNQLRYLKLGPLSDERGLLPRLLRRCSTNPCCTNRLSQLSWDLQLSLKRGRDFDYRVKRPLKIELCEILGSQNRSEFRVDLQAKTVEPAS